MPQPDYVPIRPADRVRPAERLPVPDAWRAERPGDIETVHQPTGTQLGNPGPDQGYGIKLAKHFSGQLKLEEREHESDVMAGCLAVALKRASIFGRAPVIHDFEHAYILWGYLGEGNTSNELVEFRRPLFEAASHHYEDQREIADLVPEETLRLTPAQLRERLVDSGSDWRELLLLAHE